MKRVAARKQPLVRVVVTDSTTCSLIYSILARVLIFNSCPKAFYSCRAKCLERVDRHAFSRSPFRSRLLEHYLHVNLIYARIFFEASSCRVYIRRDDIPSRHCQPTRLMGSSKYFERAFHSIEVRGKKVRYA